MLNDHIKLYEQYLQSHGLIFSSKRQIIAEYALASSEAFQADQLSGRLKSKDITRPTVYRTLSELVEADVILNDESNPPMYHWRDDR